MVFLNCVDRLPSADIFRRRQTEQVQGMQPGGLDINTDGKVIMIERRRSTTSPVAARLTDSVRFGAGRIRYIKHIRFVVV